MPRVAAHAPGQETCCKYTVTGYDCRVAFNFPFFALFSSQPNLRHLVSIPSNRQLRTSQAMKPALLFTAVLGCGAVAVSAA